MDPAVSYPSHDIPSAIVVADVDGDGRKDVLVTHSGMAGWASTASTPRAISSTRSCYPIPAASSRTNPQGLAVGDINGDGRPDAVIADSINGLVVLRHVNDISLALAVTAPVADNTILGVPLTVRWTAGDTSRSTGFDVVGVVQQRRQLRADRRAAPGFRPTARECPWTPTGAPAPTFASASPPATAGARPRLRRRPSTVVTPSITVTRPTRGAVRRARPTTIRGPTICPPSETVRIELTPRRRGLVRDAGGRGPHLQHHEHQRHLHLDRHGSGRVRTARVRVTLQRRLWPPAAAPTAFSIRTAALTVTVRRWPDATLYATSISVAWTTQRVAGPHRAHRAQPRRGIDVPDGRDRGDRAFRGKLQRCRVRAGHHQRRRSRHDQWARDRYGDSASFMLVAPTSPSRTQRPVPPSSSGHRRRSPGRPAFPPPARRRGSS